MSDEEVSLARFSSGYDYIVDSDGNRVEFHDSRVVHVWAIDTSPYASRMIANCFQKLGWRCRLGEETDVETFQYAKQLCSGRECLPCAALTGAALKDISRNREEGEISIYYNLDQDGPCQNGGWTSLWETFGHRLNLKNVIFLAYPGITTNYLGQGEGFAFGLGIAAALGDLLDEAENTLKCLAKDRDEALNRFEKETDCLIEAAQKGIRFLYSALKTWASEMAKIPLKAAVEETPKVLLFGGINLLFVHYPITRYFLEQGIIPKLVDFTEGLCWLESEFIMRYGFKRGLLTPKEQFSKLSLLFSLLDWRNDKKECLTALRSRLHIGGIDFFIKRFRKAMEKSGLLFDTHIPFRVLAEEGNKFVSYNGFSETPVTTGRFLCSIQEGVFDGLINVGSFNCQPAMNSQAILRPLANMSDIPYAAIDCEGPWISANQRRLLETVAVKAKRIREKKRSLLPPWQEDHPKTQ